MIELDAWGADRADDIVDLLLRCAPDEDLTPDEVLTACHERPGIVMGSADGEAVVAVGMGRDLDGSLVASVRLVAVGPGVQRRGRGAALLDHAERWAAERDVDRIVIGGFLPFSLWPGVAEGSAMDHLAASRGYVVDLEWDAHSVPTTHRAEPPAGVGIRRAVHDTDVTAVLLAATSMWPRRADEIARALDHGTCHVALTEVDGEMRVVGVGCHSITRAAWAGPLLVVDEYRRRGIGRALLGQICRDLMIAEFPAVTIGDVPDDRAGGFLDAIEAKPTIRYRRLTRRLD